MNDIDWPLLVWAQSPPTDDPCLGMAKYKSRRGRIATKQCTCRKTRGTPEGAYCLPCWSALPTCDACQATKGVHKHGCLWLCVACYCPEYSEEYLRYSAAFALAGETLGSQLEALNQGRYFISGTRVQRHLRNKLKELGVPRVDGDLHAPLELRADSKARWMEKREKLDKLRGK